MTSLERSRTRHNLFARKREEKVVGFYRVEQVRDGRSAEEIALDELRFSHLSPVELQVDALAVDKDKLGHDGACDERFD